MTNEPIPSTPELDSIVRRTEGVQPGRRLFHSSAGVLIAWLLTLPRPTRIELIVLLAGALLIAGTLDFVRLRSPAANVRFFKALRLLASPREKDQVASSTWYLIGVLATVLIAPVPYAASAILVLALADPSASVVGRVWGRRRIGSGTVLGTLVFVTVAAVVLGVRHTWALAIPTAIVVSAVEVLRVPIDDNLRVPIAAALTLMGFGVWLG